MIPHESMLKILSASSKSSGVVTFKRKIQCYQPRDVKKAEVNVIFTLMFV